MGLLNWLNGLNGSGDTGEIGDQRKDGPNTEGGPPNNISDPTLRQSGERDLSGVSQQRVEIASGALRWPENPPQNIYEPQYGGRQFIGNPDGDLHRGPEPQRIDRIANTRVFGHAGPMELDNNNRKFGEIMRVGHVPTTFGTGKAIPRKSPIQSNATDDNFSFPAARIGNPL